MTFQLSIGNADGISPLTVSLVSALCGAVFASIIAYISHALSVAREYRLQKLEELFVAADGYTKAHMNVVRAIKLYSESSINHDTLSLYHEAEFATVKKDTGTITSLVYLLFQELRPTYSSLIRAYEKLETHYGKMQSRPSPAMVAVELQSIEASVKLFTSAK